MSQTKHLIEHNRRATLAGRASYPRVFLSHDSADAEDARRIRNLLADRLRIRLFLEEDVNFGENWESKLRKALRDADVLVALLTPHAIDSTWVLQDVGAAWALGKPIIPVVRPRYVLNQFSFALRPE